MTLCAAPPMREVWDIVRRVAGVDVTVLISGETGTGKDLVARAIHHLSARRSQPFVKVNCAAVPRELLESELFGHERGAFTGAHQLKIGKFEAANHGTIFLDEIGELHPALQAKLLHVLQDGTFSRVGGQAITRVDVRILAATNQDLERAVLAERFREDLYYRLNVVHIAVPPLRERRAEIPLLVEYFIQRYARMYGRPEIMPDPEALERLLHHSYPGNVRELENIVKRMIVLDDPLLARIPLGIRRNGHDAGRVEPESETGNGTSLKDIARNAARAAEREAIARILHQTHWNRVKAAKLLKISYRALLYKIKDVGLSRKRTTVGSHRPSVS
jgi:two-component system response regulator AtoC